MMPWFSYWSKCQTLDGDESSRVFFLADSGTSGLGLLQPFSEQYISQRTPRHLIFISTVESKSALTQLLDSKDTLLRVRGGSSVLRRPTVSHWTFARDGILRCLRALQGKTPSVEQRTLIHDGLLNIFHERVGLLEAPRNTHYVKPSGKHSATFIRTGDVLVSDSETMFIASSLMRVTPKGPVQYILCDTSSIAIVGYALKALGTVRGHGRGTPRIHTFQSYKGVSNLSLVDPDTTLVFISASTSGDLAERVIEQTGIAAKRVITLFYRGKESCAGSVLCDMSIAGTRHKAISEIESYPGHDCPLCREGREKIWILGDQFEARTAEAGLKLVTVEDCPKWLSRFVHEAQGKGVISCHKVLRDGESPRELFFDFSSIYKRRQKREFRKWKDRLERFLNQGVPAALKRIVYLPDNASRLLALNVSAHLNKVLRQKRRLQMISSTDLHGEIPGFKLDHGATLVVASAAVTGRSLLAVSQRLRDAQPNDAVGYLVGICRTRSNEELNQLRGNLSYGSTGPSEHPFMTLETIHAPDSGPFGRTPWSEEEKILRKALDDWQSKHNKAAKLIVNRLTELGHAAALDALGLRDNLFLPTLKEKSLQLRRFFAFFDFRHSRDSASQADVYFVITGILHHLRQLRRESGGIENNVYHRTLIAPRTFDRFNDGVIQAAFLRAAHAEELDYRPLPTASADMREIVETVLQNSNNPTGEACLEFLLALAGRKLRLAESDENSLKPLLRSLAEKSSDCATLIAQIG